MTAPIAATLHTDGAARHKQGESTGPAGIGAVLRAENGEVLGRVAEGVGETTNNVAEYKALIAGLEMAREHGVTHLQVFVDSPVVAGHMLKGHRVRAEHLQVFVALARDLLDSFPQSTLQRVPREQNAEADRLANLGADKAMGA